MIQAEASLALPSVPVFEASVLPLCADGYRVALVMLNSQTEAEDAVQEAVLKAWRKHHQLKATTDPRPWFLTIVANECRAVRRRRWWRMSVLAEPPVSTEPPFDDFDGEHVRRAVAALPMRYRIVVALHYYLDLKLAEIAEIVGIPVGTVKSRLHRAQSRLKDQLTVDGVPKL